MIPVCAVVPSYGRECLNDCLDSLIPQVDGIVLIQTMPFPVRMHLKIQRIPWYHKDRALNISEWWNAGLDAASRMFGQPEWNVLIVNDDVIAPPDLAVVLGNALRQEGADLAWPPDPGGRRAGLITGWCFMLRGESGIRADPELRWYHGDDDIYLQARARGGVISVDGCQVIHRYPGGHDQLMREQIDKDADYFSRKWGRDA